MTDHEKSPDEYVRHLREAVERSVEGDTDWPAFHARLNAAAAARLAELRRRVSAGHRAAATVGAAWWDYAARVALAAVPLGLVAALLLVTYLRSGESDPGVQPFASSMAEAPGNGDAARAAFESVLTGGAAPQAVITTLIPVPAAAFLADSDGRSRR